MNEGFKALLVLHPWPHLRRSVNSLTTYYSYRLPKIVFDCWFAWWVSSQDSTTELPTESTKSVKCDRQVWFSLKKLCTVLYVLRGLTLWQYKCITGFSLYRRKRDTIKCLCKDHVCGVILVTVPLISEGDNEPICVQSYEACMMKWYHQNCSYRVLVMVSLRSFALLYVCFTTKCCLCCLQTKRRALLVQETAGWSYCYFM